MSGNKCIIVDKNNIRCSYEKIYNNGMKLLCKKHFKQMSKKEGGNFYNNNVDGIIKELNIILPNEFKQEYEIKTLLGYGSFGYVFKIYSIKNKQYYAMKINYLIFDKLKRVRDAQKQYMSDIQAMYEYEYWLMREPFSHIRGIIKAKSTNEYKEIKKSNYTLVYGISELYGQTIDSYFNSVNKKLSSNTIKQIGRQLLSIIEQLHNINYVYIDFNLDNILLKKDSINEIVLVDLGLVYNLENVKDYKPSTPYAQQVFVGINGNYGDVPTKLGDIQSVCYILTYLTLGYLPWYRYFNTPSKIGAYKVAFCKSKIFMKLPNWLKVFVVHVYQYQTEYELPDYVKLKKLLI